MIDQARELWRGQNVNFSRYSAITISGIVLFALSLPHGMPPYLKIVLLSTGGVGLLVATCLIIFSRCMQKKVSAPVDKMSTENASERNETAEKGENLVKSATLVPAVPLMPSLEYSKITSTETIECYDLEAHPPGNSDILSTWVIFEKKDGPPSSGDIPIKGGKGFIYSRSTDNIFGNYVEADYLKKKGFTYQEAARLSPSLWVDLIIENAQVEEKAKEVIKPLSLKQEIPSPLEDEVEKIYQQFIQDLTDCERWNSTSLFLLMVGTKDFRWSFLKNEKQCMTILFEGLVEDKPTEVFIKKMKLKESFFEPFLKKAARLTAVLRFLLGTKAEKTGNILPAIYHHLVIPLAIRDAMQLEPEEERKLIKQIALCALRERSDFPQTVTISDSDLEALLSRLII